MTMTYMSLVQRNPIVSYSSQGRARNVWCNAIVESTSVKALVIRVFARTDGLAEATATRLKAFIEEQKLINRGVLVVAKITISSSVWNKSVGAYEVVIRLKAQRGDFDTSGVHKPVPKKPIITPPHNQHRAFTSGFSNAFS